MKKLLLVLIVGGIFIYHRAHRPAPQSAPDSYSAQASEPEARHESGQSLPAVERETARFTCDGRQYCSQMTSCEEATYFLQNCPDVKMDGEGDGVPCEKQWCGRR